MVGLPREFSSHAICTIIPNEDWSVIEMHHVIVFDEHQRRKGHGTRMISNVRRFFPEATIWVDTWDHSRPFWQVMVDKEYIDFIGNDYAWPCFDTNCFRLSSEQSQRREKI